MTRVGMITEISWEVDEEVNRDKNGEADEMKLEVDSKDEACDKKTTLRSGSLNLKRK